MCALKINTAQVSERPLTLINGAQTNTISVFDRSVQFGDALFDTSRIEAGVLLNWQGHWQRLADGLVALDFPHVNKADLMANIKKAYALFGKQNAVCKIIISRGQSVRGYATVNETIDDDEQVTQIVQMHPTDVIKSQLRVCVSPIKLPIDPTLAELKHANRLHQVLARRQLLQGFDEAIVCDSKVQVRCAISANIFALFDGMLITPPVDNSGVAGVARAALLPHATQAPLTSEELLTADAIYLTNSVQGVRWVEEYHTGEATHTYKQQETDYERLCVILKEHEYATGLVMRR